MNRAKLLQWLVLSLITCLGLAGCAHRPVVEHSEHLFDDRLFAAAGEPVDADSALALSPAMQAYARRELLPLMHRDEPHRALLEALYSGRQLKLHYDSARTRSAAEAFDARAGNCMSLVVMTAAFARELGLAVRFQSVQVDPSWGRRGSLQFAIGHINVSVGRPLLRQRAQGDSANWLTVDFLPQRDLRSQRYEVIDEHTVLAMYMNNKAAEALSEGRLDDAYWWVRGAIAQDRQLLLAYNTLGVVYQRRGHAARAEQVLRFALALEPDNLQVLGNLGHLLVHQQRADEARPLLARLAQLQPDPPFKFFELGRTAMQQGDFKQARTMFERELQRDPDYHEFHFWLALALLNLGDRQEASRHLVLARDNSGTRDEEALYAAKLARLKAAMVH